MENGSIFWKKAAEWFTCLGLPYISELEAMFILAAAFLVLLFILWLIFRKVRLWYWKTNIQIDTLKSIDTRLHNVEDKLSGSLRIEAAEKQTTTGDEAEPSTEDISDAPPQENVGMTIVGKSGRIYTEAELELQIRE